jgi:uncharacterized protein (DUF2252 family)
MAWDLAQTPSSGIVAQLYGDCHISNFGMFASPERSLVFDLNDFDETLPGPFEWDVKRTAASIVVAARNARLSAASGAGARTEHRRRNRCGDAAPSRPHEFPVRRLAHNAALVVRETGAGDVYRKARRRAPNMN